MKKVLFRSYGDATYGLGHIIRSVAFAKYLKAYHEVVIYFATSPNDSESFLDFLKTAQISLVDFNQIRNNNFDHLIYDMPFYDQTFFELVREINFEKKIGLDYFFYNSDDVNVALNLYSHGKPETSKFEIKEGIHYAILRDNILNKSRTTTGGLPENILITFGSADPSNNTCRVLDQLPDTNLKINVILGVLFKNEVDLEKSIKRFSKERITIFRNVSNIEDYIMANNLVFCGGGTTLLESIHLCRPSIVISQSLEEHNFAQALSQSGLCYVMSGEALNSAAMESLIKTDFCTSISYACQKVDLGLGKKLIAEELMGRRNG
jgi:spore coat polysaccharide biosynthesis predicted glycosyltransferase SpsG